MTICKTLATVARYVGQILGQITLYLANECEVIIPSPFINTSLELLSYTTKHGLKTPLQYRLCNSEGC
jgi:hypothetical protein